MLGPVHASALVHALAASLARTGSTFRDARGTIALSALWAVALRRAERLRAEVVRAEGPAHVLLHVEPGREWTASFLALLASGCAAVPVPLGAPAAEIAYFAETARARFAIASDALAGALPPGLPRLAPAALDAPAEDAGAGASAPAVDAGHATALILFTSGTTGRPKAALLTHDNLDAQTAALVDAWAMSPRDTLLHALPLHHLHGVVVALLTSLRAGASLIALPRFDADAVRAALPEATVWMAVPAMFERLLSRHAELAAGDQAALAAALSGLRLLTSGSAALPVKWAERLRALTGTIPLERYGMTEIGMALSNPLDPAGREPGCVGRPLPGVALRIVDERGEDAASGEGELWVRGPSVFAGYLGQPEITAASFAAGGWFKTGDIGRREASGAIRLLGRASSDILKTGGEKVSALEIEEVVRQHPAVADVAVVGVPDDQWGDRVVAAVVAQPGEAAACATAPLRAWLKERLSPFKVPREVVLFEALPRNAMGKVVKAEIARRVAGSGPPEG